MNTTKNYLKLSFSNLSSIFFLCICFIPVDRYNWRRVKFSGEKCDHEGKNFEKRWFERKVWHIVSSVRVGRRVLFENNIRETSNTK